MFLLMLFPYSITLSALFPPGCTSEIASATADGSQATANRATAIAAKGTPLPAVQAGVIAFLAVNDGPTTEAIFSNLKVYSL